MCLLLRWLDYLFLLNITGALSGAFIPSMKFLSSEIMFHLNTFTSDLGYNTVVIPWLVLLIATLIF